MATSHHEPEGKKKNCDNYSTRYGCRFLANPRNTVPGSFSLARSCDQKYIQIARRSRLREQVNVILIEVVREQAVIQLQLWAAGPDRTLDHRNQNTSLSPLWVGTIAAPIPAALSVCGYNSIHSRSHRHRHYHTVIYIPPRYNSCSNSN